MFSFYATKNLTSAEGGMVTTHDQAPASKMRVLALHGMSKDAWNRYAKDGSWYYEVLACGFKYNLSDVHAAIGLQQLRKLEQMNNARARITERYNRAFADVQELQIPSSNVCCHHAWHLYILRLNLAQLSIDRAEFIRQLGRGRYRYKCALHPGSPAPVLRAKHSHSGVSVSPGNQHV